MKEGEGIKQYIYHIDTNNSVVIVSRKGREWEKKETLLRVMGA